jgi:signal transduction histidine kinase
LILAAAMALIGELVTDLTSRSITAGVADTAAASLDIMLADELSEIGPVRPLTSAARKDLDSLFSVANDAQVNKLIEIRLRNLDGSLLYESLGGLLDPAPAQDALANARAGKVTSRLLDLPLAPIGPLQPATLPVLKVVTPVHDSENGTVEATAELYFAGGGLVDLERRSEWRVWTSVAAIGGLAIVALFVLVDWAARTIASQRARLAASLAASQELSAENTQLRQQANVANERLLSRVGSDLHDGPLQLLALLILKLSRHAPSTNADTAIARQAMEELRSISAGLVLPELSGLTLRETIMLAVQRHENATGVRISCDVGAVPDEVSPDLKVCVFRTVQEGLSNAHKHGRAGSATLSATMHADEVVIVIGNATDCASPNSASRPQLGLDGMRERLEAVGGHFELANAGDTATLTIVTPLRPA